MNYVRPTVLSDEIPVRLFEKPLDEVFSRSIAALEERSFIVANSDLKTGIIEIRHQGYPETYLDCGSIKYAVSNREGGIVKQFPASKSSMSYELIYGQSQYFIERHIDLNAVIKLTLIETAHQFTQASVNVHYEVTRRIYVRLPNANKPEQTVDVIAFNSGLSASFPDALDGANIHCTPTGKLERDVLAALGQ